MNLNNFSLKEKLLLMLGVYKPLNDLIDKGLIRKDLFYSPLFQRHSLQLIIKHYGGSQGQKVDEGYGGLGFGFLHYAFIHALNSQRILCIGSKEGFIPAICALACKDKNSGKVDFIDAGKDEVDEANWGGTGFWKKNDLAQHFSILDLNDWIIPHIMTTSRFVRLNSRKKWDYVYIDGDHSYEGVRRDYRFFWPKLIKSGMMSFHDVTLRGLYKDGKEFGVWRLWTELKHKNKIIIGDSGASLGFIQKT